MRQNINKVKPYTSSELHSAEPVTLNEVIGLLSPRDIKNVLLKALELLQAGDLNSTLDLEHIMLCGREISFNGPSLSAYYCTTQSYGGKSKFASQIDAKDIESQNKLSFIHFCYTLTSFKPKQVEPIFNGKTTFNINYDNPFGLVLKNAYFECADMAEVKRIILNLPE